MATRHCDYGHDDDEVSIDTQTALIDTTSIAEQLAAMTFEAATSPLRATLSRFDVLTPDEYEVYKDKPSYLTGKVVIFGGDFRQVLPVIPGGGRSETILATLNSSYLWEHNKVLKLTKNMRLLAGLSDDAAKELESF